MILLKATTESIKIVTSTTADIDYSVSWVDVTTSAFSPSTSEGKINSITSTTALAAPAASTQRQVKLITISNVHASASNSITIVKDISGTTYRLAPATTLQAGECLIYLDNKGWRYYSASGQIRGMKTAAGSNSQVQINNNGLLGADADLTIDTSNNDLILSGTNTAVTIAGVTNEPSTPAAGNSQIYSSSIVGKMHLKIKGDKGASTPIQAAMYGNYPVMFSPGASGGSTIGATTTLSTAVSTLPTTTNIYTMMRRTTFSSVVTTTNQQIGARTEAAFCRGHLNGCGGFMFACRFGFDSIKTGCRAFVGLAVGTTAVVTVDPSTLLNTVGFGFDLADSAWTFMHNDGTGTATKETIAGQGTLATNNTGYDAFIWCAPNDSTVYYRLDRTDTGATLCNTSTNTDLPLNTTLLCAHCAMSNGTANIVAGDAVLGINRLYVETDR